MRARLLLPALVAFAAAALVAQPTVVQPSGPEAATETRTLPLRHGAKLKVANVNGDIRVEAWDQEQVAWTGAFTPSGQGEHAKVHFEGGRDGLEIRGEYPKARGFRGRSARVQMTLKVPRRALANLDTVNGNLGLNGTQAAARLHTVNGEIQVRAAGGGVEAETVNGRIGLDEVKGRIALETVNGGIEAMRLDPEGQGLKASTVNGAIHLHVDGLKGELRARAVNGSVSFQAKGAEGVKLTRRAVEAILPGSTQSLQLNTVNGGITIE